MLRKLALLLLALLATLPASAYNVADYYNVTAHQLLYSRAFNAQGTSGSPAWATGIRGDDQPRIQLTTDGSLRFGAGGTSTVDLMLKRVDANTLELRDVADTAYRDLVVGNITATTLTVNGTPVGIANGGTGLAAVGSNNTVPISNGTGLAYSTLDQNNFAQKVVVFGGVGGSSVRALPTSGALVGEYWNVGAWQSTGPITCNYCRIHNIGNFTLSHALTIGTELKGGRGTRTSGGSGGSYAGQNGQGLGGGGGAQQWTGGATTIGNGGGGGANGGDGGNGGGFNTTNNANLGGFGGRAYSIFNQLNGSGGGGGGSGASATAGGDGGDGGGALYLEVSNGDITLDANITGQGGAGGSTAVTLVGGGGGGSGATVEMLCTGNITITASCTINLSGGAGGSASVGVNTPGGAGGGGGRAWGRCLGVYTKSGTISVSGGTAGTGGASTTAATNGSAGEEDIQGGVGYSIRTAP